VDQAVSTSSSIRYMGKVKWFNDRKGYGFIVNDLDEDIFVHYTEIRMRGFRTLREGDKVSFELTQGPKGLLAKNVNRMRM